MTSDTFVSKHYNSVYAGGDSRRQKVVRCGEAGIYPGYGIRVVNSVAYLSKQSDDHISGVADLKVGHALDTVYASGTLIEWFRVGQDTEVYVYLLAASPAVQVDEGEDCIISATDGMFASGDDNTDLNYVAGHFCEYSAGHVTDNLLVKITLSA